MIDQLEDKTMINTAAFNVIDFLNDKLEIQYCNMSLVNRVFKFAVNSLES